MQDVHSLIAYSATTWGHSGSWKWVWPPCSRGRVYGAPQFQFCVKIRHRTIVDVPIRVWDTVKKAAHFRTRDSRPTFPLTTSAGWKSGHVSAWLRLPRRTASTLLWQLKLSVGQSVTAGCLLPLLGQRGHGLAQKRPELHVVKPLRGRSRLEEERGLPSYVETGSGNSLYSCYSLSNNGTIAHVRFSLNAAPCFFPRRCVCTCRASVCTATSPPTPAASAELLTFSLTTTIEQLPIT